MKSIYKCVLIGLWLFPSLFLSYIKYIDPFIFWPLSDIILAINGRSVVPTTPGTEAYNIIIYIISIISGIHPLKLIFLPIGTIIVPLTYFVLSKQLFRSNAVASLLSIYVSLDFTLYPTQYSIFAYTWTNTLFLIFILLYIKYLSNHDIRYGFLIIPTFIATFFFHTTYVGWMILFSFYLNFFIALSKKSDAVNVNSRMTTELTIAFMTIYFGFNQVFYNMYIKKMVSFEYEKITNEFVNTAKSFAGLSDVNTIDIGFILPNSAPTELMGIAIFFRTLFILAVLIISLAYWLIKNRKNYRYNINDKIILSITLLFVGISHTVAYAIYGHMSLRFIPFIYPIVVVLILKVINTKGYITMGVLLLLVLLSFLQTGSFMIENYDSKKDIITDMHESCTNLVGKIQYFSKILSDFDTSQICYFYFKSNNGDFDRIYYNPDRYRSVIGEKEISVLIDYVIINKNVKETSSINWKIYKPLSAYISLIESNIGIDKFYDDGNIWIFINRDRLRSMKL